MKEITDNAFKLLLQNGDIRSARNGFIDKEGSPIGYSRTKNKRYIEDRFVRLAETLVRK